ncbi:MAG: DNA alkylation repair protein [Candidatus Falkowbacteria bacterium]|nr:DNA alkylation repair protein [Candidatus Falkowbacteria bacterium]
MSPSFKILKRSGHREEFSIQKLIRGLVRSGADESLANRIAHKVGQNIKGEYSSQNIYELAKRYLKNSHPVVGARYSLREAIMRLGPAGYDFEKYVMLILREYGYETYLPEILHGECVTHEVDVVAEKDGKRIIIECKLRNEYSIYINIRDTMAAWARYMDLKEGAKIGKCIKIDELWIMTNTRFSEDALHYGGCKNMKLISWNTPTEMPLPVYIDEKKLYPVTILASIKRYHLIALSKCDILLIKQLVEYRFSELIKLTKLNRVQLEPLVIEAKKILSFKNIFELENLKDLKKAEVLKRFFKTGVGEYGEGDLFLGVIVPKQRIISKKYINLELKEIESLLRTNIHECRLTALFILIEKYNKAKNIDKKNIFKLYLKNTQCINNWDLIDSSAPKIIGDYLLDKPRDILYALANSQDLWEKRISIISTYAFIKKNEFNDTFKIAKLLLKDKHDLIHKAVRWMLREDDKNNLDVERLFLDQYCKDMPRVTLRYAIEKMDSKEKEKYLKK